MEQTSTKINNAETIGFLFGKLLATDSENLKKLLRLFDGFDEKTRNAYISVGEEMTSK